MQLELDLAALDVLEPQDHVLDEPPILPTQLALVGKAVPVARPDGPDDGAVAHVLGVHVQNFHQGFYLDLRISHWVISAESVLVKHLL